MMRIVVVMQSEEVGAPTSCSGEITMYRKRTQVQQRSINISLNLQLPISIVHIVFEIYNFLICQLRNFRFLFGTIKSNKPIDKKQLLPCFFPLLYHSIPTSSDVC